jgi:hypothetical protein
MLLDCIPDDSRTNQSAERDFVHGKATASVVVPAKIRVEQLKSPDDHLREK